MSRNTWRPSPDALLNPRRDKTFKALFTQDTPESKIALISFLEAAIGQKISDVQIAENDIPIEKCGERGVEFDVHCIFADGTVAEVEMEGRERDYDFGKRAEYNVSRLLATHFNASRDWQNVPKAYQISVLDFIYKKDDTNPVHKYEMYDRDNKCGLTKTLNIIFLELPKLPKTKNCETKNLTNLIKWGMFLKNVDKTSQTDLIEKLTQEDRGLKMARTVLKSVSKEEQEWYVEWQLEKAERDRISEINSAKRRYEEGMAQGAHNKAVETTRALLSLGVVTKWQIVQATGLPIDEVEKIAQTLNN